MLQVFRSRIGIANSGTTATVILSEAVGGVQTAGCVLSVELDVPEGLALGMPTTILRGVSLGRTRLERRYSFEGAGATNAFIEVPPNEDFVIVDRSDQIQSASCGANRRVSYKVDVTAQVLDADTFFQLDSVDLDTTFRTGTDWQFCDRSQKLVVAPGQSGDFCDGPNERPCADGLVCDRVRDPNADEGVCSEPRGGSAGGLRTNTTVRGSLERSGVSSRPCESTRNMKRPAAVTSSTRS